MMLAFAIGAALAAGPAGLSPVVAASDFDLPSDTLAANLKDRAPPLVPQPPRNLDTRDFAVDAPEAEWRVADRGPVLVVGAMGGRRSGMPRLAHVAIDWSF